MSTNSDFIDIFVAADTAQKNSLNKQDLLAYAIDNGQAPGKFATRWMTLFDSNSDGIIDFTEFCDTLGLDERETLEIFAKKRREMSSNGPTEEVVETTTTTVVEEKEPPARKNTRQRPAESETTTTTVIENTEPPAKERVRQLPPKSEMYQPNSSPAQKNETYKPTQSGATKSEMYQPTQPAPPETKRIKLEVEILEVEMADSMQEKVIELGAQLVQKHIQRTGLEEPYINFVDFSDELNKKYDSMWFVEDYSRERLTEITHDAGHMICFEIQDGQRLLVYRQTPKASGGFCGCCI